uniref:Immunoglobulin V-set domain-containing protein n=1 Tax=Equus caballus TaxID=9796 RepID=A0A9L0TDB8_HORSE
MLWTLAFLLAFLAPATWISSNVEGTQMSITKQAGSSVVFTCDIKQRITYVHWYRHKEGIAPQRIVYYHHQDSRLVSDPGIRLERYRVYESTERNRKIEIRKLEQSDSGIVENSNHSVS